MSEARTLEFENPLVEMAISAGPLHIDEVVGMAYFKAYQHDLILRAQGMTFAEIGISERRAAARPCIISPLAVGFETIADYGLLKNPRLTNPGSIAHLKLTGFMQAEAGLSNPGVQQLANDLRAAYLNPNISSVILEINSGGGQVIAGDMLRNAITERNKPVVVYGWLVGSAAYDAASAADEIIASSPAAMFGSIGTMYTVNMAELKAMSEIYTEFYGQTAPKKNEAHRLAKENNFAGIQKLVDETTQVFQNSVRSFRDLKGSKEKVSETLNGSIWYGEEAKNRGLVDSIGNFNFAISRAKRWEKMRK